MARFSVSLAFLALLSASLSLVGASPEFNQEEQNRNADCDNGCFFSSFPGGSCTNDAACMCTQQKYREKYFCCMAEKCASPVLPDSIVRQNSECEARSMPFTFDIEAVCGIRLTTSASFTASATSTASGSSTYSTASASPTSVSTAATPGSSSTGSESSSSGSIPVPTANGASIQGVTSNGIAIVLVASGMLLF